MKLDTDLVVNGGYIKYTNQKDADGTVSSKATDQALALIKELDALEEKSETTFGTKLSAITGAVVSTGIMEDDLDNDALIAWLFSADRTANQYGTVLSPDSDPNDDKDDEAAFVAYFIESHLAWQLSARDGYISEQLSDWVKALREGYEVTGLDRVKDKKPYTTTVAG